MRMNVLLPVIALLSFCSPALAAKKPPEDGSAPTKVHKSGSQSAVSAKHRALRNARYRRHHGGSGGGFDPETGDGADFCGSMAMPATQLREISRGFSSYHAGIDLMAPKGSPIRAAAAGTVIYAGWYFAYGNIVDIQHADGVVTRYAHMTTSHRVSKPGSRCRPMALSARWALPAGRTARMCISRFGSMVAR